VNGRAAAVALALLVGGCAGEDVPLGTDTAVRGRVVDTFLTDRVAITLPRDLTVAPIVALIPGPMPGDFETHAGEGGPDGSFLIPGVPADSAYYLRFDRTHLVTALRTVDLGQMFAGRPDAMRATDAWTQLQVSADQLAPWQSGDELELWATNVGASERNLTQHLLAIPAAGATTLDDTTIAYADLSAPNLIDAEKGDRAILTQLEARRASDGSQYTGLVRVCDLLPFTMVEGEATPTSCSFTEILQDQTVLVQGIKRGRFRTLAPAVHPLAQDGGVELRLYADRFGIRSGGPTLIHLALPSASSDATPGVLSYSDPFPATWGRVVVLQDVVTMSYTLPGGRPLVVALPIAVEMGDQEVDQVRLEPLVGPPRNLRIGDLDAQQSPSGAGTTPELSWSAPVLGLAARYTVDINRLYVRDGATRAILIARFVTTGTSVSVPPNLLKAHETYYLSVQAQMSPAVGQARSLAVPPAAWEGRAQVVSSMFTP
jgi:hypothetical protein